MTTLQDPIRITTQSSADALVVPLLTLRWQEAVAALPALSSVSLTWDVGESTLFLSPRCTASTTGDGSAACHVRFAPRFFTLPEQNRDAVIRHELGHVIDLTIPWMTLDEWGQSRGLWLPTTPERRADAIAYTLWGSPIYYDEQLIQTIQVGIHPRPEHLGL